MQDEPLTVDVCDELAEALRERAVSLPNGSEREKLLMLAECFRELANIKRLVLHKVNYPPDDEQRLRQYRQVGDILDKLLDASNLTLPTIPTLRPKLRKIVLDGDRLGLQ
jgi:hypothetical protein